MRLFAFACVVCAACAPVEEQRFAIGLDSGLECAEEGEVRAHAPARLEGEWDVTLVGCGLTWLRVCILDGVAIAFPNEDCASERAPIVEVQRSSIRIGRTDVPFCSEDGAIRLCGLRLEFGGGRIVGGSVNVGSTGGCIAEEAQIVGGDRIADNCPDF